MRKTFVARMVVLLVTSLLLSGCFQQERLYLTLEGGNVYSFAVEENLLEPIAIMSLLEDDSLAHLFPQTWRDTTLVEAEAGGPDVVIETVLEQAGMTRSDVQNHLVESVREDIEQDWEWLVQRVAGRQDLEERVEYMETFENSLTITDTQSGEFGIRVEVEKVPVELLVMFDYINFTVEELENNHVQVSVSYDAELIGDFPNEGLYEMEEFMGFSLSEEPPVIFYLDRNGFEIVETSSNLVENEEGIYVWEVRSETGRTAEFTWIDSGAKFSFSMVLVVIVLFLLLFGAGGFGGYVLVQKRKNAEGNSLEGLGNGFGPGPGPSGFGPGPGPSNFGPGPSGPSNFGPGPSGPSNFGPGPSGPEQHGWDPYKENPTQEWEPENNPNPDPWNNQNQPTEPQNPYSNIETPWETTQTPQPAPQPDLPPQGWYKDPGGTNQERWWDGTQWTNQLR